VPASPFIHNRLYSFISMLLCVTIISSSIPQQGWSLLFDVHTAYAARTGTNLVSVLPGGTNSLLAQALQQAGLNPMGMLGPDGQPNGMVMDIGAMQAPVHHQPDSLTNPISISRVQSAYRAADAVVYGTPGGTARFDAVLRNVGNAPSAFPLLITAPLAGPMVADGLWRVY
jgi:hypothetical protein